MATRNRDPLTLRTEWRVASVVREGGGSWAQRCGRSRSDGRAARERDQFSVIPTIGRAKRREIAPTLPAGFDQGLAAPNESRASEALDQEISSQTSMTAVAVGKRVNPDQPVMKAQCDLVGRKYWSAPTR